MNHQGHLGDKIFAISDGYGVLLHTAKDKDNSVKYIYLNPEVLEELYRFAGKCKFNKKIYDITATAAAETQPTCGFAPKCIDYISGRCAGIDGSC